MAEYDLGFFTQKPFSQERKSFLLCLGTIEPSLVSIQKTDLKLKPPIQMNVRYSII